MGRSKFPGKPSKSVFKERVCVLYKYRNKQSMNIASANLSEKTCNNVLGTDERCFADASFQSGEQKTESVNCVAETDFTKPTNPPLLFNECKESSSVSNLEPGMPKTGIHADKCAETSSISDLQKPKTCLTEIERLIKKKTVTFKNNLETSDDVSILNRIHNPRNKGPLISIMKKECPTSHGCFTRGDGIVRPSRLTEIIKNNENIDKTISLSFRSTPIPENKHRNDIKIKKPSLSVRKCKSGSFFLGLQSNENLEQLAPESNKRNFCRLLESWTLRTLCSKSDNFSFPDTHSVCIICSTTVNCKNQQNLEYGVITCDVCRKFISNLTFQNVSSSTNAIIPLKLQCQRRYGECSISALPKKDIKSFEQVYNDRCSACWLKKCVRAFQLPYGHEFRLNPKLLETLRNKIDEKYFNEQYDALSSCSTQRNNKKVDSVTNSNGAKNKTTSLNWRLIKPSGELVDSLKSHQNVFSNINDMSKLTDDLTYTRCSNSILSKKPKSMKKTLELQSSASNIVREYAKRQTNYFKGPRVKHVCRSASIALGQQIATFSNDCGDISKLLQSKSQIDDSSFPKSLIENICFLSNRQQNFSQKVGKVVNESLIELEVGQDIWKKCIELSTVESSKNLLTHSCSSDKGTQMRSFKAERSLAFDKMLMPEKKNTESNKTSKKHIKKHDVLMLDHRNIKEKSMSISIDFWNTTVSGEVSQMGFGLILTDPVSILALCFLCGSMDLDNLLFCASCCEPYHNYCVNEKNIRICKVLRDNNYTNKGLINDEVINQLNWICPRCTICSTCNMSSGEKLKCQKCKKHYHSTCMGTSKALLGADRPLICKSCLKCQSCFNTKVSKYVGSQPICIQCFQLRNSESRCLVCNRFFCNILDPIILECSLCHQLVHSKCEGLTEEQSNLLSNISTDIQFVCKKCAQTSEEAKKLANGWRARVNEELNVKLLDILKLLSGSRQASVLKKRTETACTCRIEEISKTRKMPQYKYENTSIFKGLNETNDIIDNDFMENSMNSKCFCHNGTHKKPVMNKNLNIMDIKTKIINGEYISLFDFDQDMNEVIAPLKNDELILTYKEILCEKFSWFQNETKTCTDALEEDMFESCNYQFLLDDMPSEDLNSKSPLPEFVGKMLNSLKQEKDNRVCALCLKEGDCNDQEESRLLYYCNNIWVHVNCAIWSCDVYEEFDGSLQNINNALYRGRLTKCVICKWLGATIKCLVKTCCNYYHFQCARKAKCVFDSNRSVYCSIHYNEKIEDKIISNFSFNIFRPLYIESEKYRTFVEPSKVRFMMGSLSVLQLGTVFPKFCDTPEAIVPINFCCTRLYWSCREPWRLVKYNVRTFIQKSTKVVTNDLGKNFTVDHSENISLVEKGLLRIANWHAKISREENDDMAKGQIVDQFTNLRFSKNGDNNGGLNSDMCIDEEPQNNSDLLPPEIKDVIFEDLPHDILDGISMLDIFPKLMIYEDLINVENKPDNLIVADCVIKRSEHRPRLGSKQDLSNGISNNAKLIEESNCSIQKNLLPRHDLKRSSSDIFLRNIHKIKSQRRCSSIPCKCHEEYYLNTSSGVCRNEMRCSNFNRKKIEHRYNDNKLNSKEKNEIENDKILVKMRRDNFKLIQLDGTDDSFMGYSNTTIENSTSKSPVKCDRCHCTYRTFCSFQRHLVNCEQISTSESETETISRPSDLLHSTVLLKTDSTENNIQAYNSQIGKNEPYTSHIRNVDEPANVLSDHINSKNEISDSSGYSCTLDVHNETSLNNAKRRNNNNYCFNGCCENTLHKVFGQCLNKFSKSLTTNNRGKSHNNSKNLIMKEKGKQINVRLKSKPKASVTPVNEETIQANKEHNVNYSQYLQNEQQYVVIDHNPVNSAPLYFQPVHNQATVQQQFFPLILSNNSIQFTSMPSSPNTLMQGSVMQTDMGGNVMLSGLQLLSLPSLQLTGSIPSHPVATLNQQHSLQLGPNHVVIANTPLTELVPNTNQMVLSVPPMYYGLETIVQNTITSSQQFVSTAMQGVLGQNASFSATTTQVFQSSTIEPVSDAGNSYILLNNSDGSAVLMPQTNVFLNGNDVHNFHTNYENVCVSFPHTFIQEPQLNNALPVLPSLPEKSNFHIQTVLNAEEKIRIPSPKKLNIKNTSTSKHTSNENVVHSEPQNCKIKTVLVGSNNLCDDSYVQIVCDGSNTFDTEYKSAVENKVNSKDSVQKQQEVTRKCVKKYKVLKKSQEDSMFMNVESSEQCKEAFSNNTITPHNFHQTEKVQPLPQLNTNHSLRNDLSQCSSTLECTEYFKTLNDSEPNKTQTSETQTLNSSKLLYTSPSLGNCLNNLSNIHLSPTLQSKQYMNPPPRPTNRVLPMQSIHKSIDKSKSKKISTSKVDVIKSFETLASNLDKEKCAFPMRQSVENNKSEISDKDEIDSGRNNELICSKTNYELVKTKIDYNYGESKVNKSLKLPNLDVSTHKPNADVPLDDFKNCNQFVSKRCDNIELLGEKVNNMEKQITGDSIGICTHRKCESVEQSPADQLSHYVMSSLPLKIQLQNKNVSKISEPLLMYEMQSEDGFYLKSKSISQIWENVFESVQVARRAHGLLSLPKGPFADLCGVQMIGLKTKTLKFLIEQLPATEAWNKYTQKYYKHPFSSSDEYFYKDGEELLENIFGASRCEPFKKRSEYDLFSWLASRHRKQPKPVLVHHSDNDLISRRCTANLPMAMKYRTLKETCRHNIGVFRSSIHGRGLFCTEDIEAGEMVIEYAGELIRSTLTDKRERCYDSKGIGCYMFKIDDNFVVDATMRGNAARFINHSCEPNCYSKVVDILGHKHIIIFSLRRIVQGEELTYDYKFPFEDIKIPCSCGSKKCRKYLN